MKAVAGQTWQIGEDVNNREIFASTSRLQNVSDTLFRSVSQRWPVFGIAVDVGSVGKSCSAPVMWALGIVRNPSVKYLNAHATIELRSAYYWSSFSTAIDVVSRLLSCTLLNLARSLTRYRPNFSLTIFLGRLPYPLQWIRR